MSNVLKSFAISAAIAASTVSAFAQDGVVSLSTVDSRPASLQVTRADGAAAYSPGSVGAMHYAVAGRATSTADVRRESSNQLTAVYAHWVAPKAGS
ncbi:hypothetical protein [Hansschlegelia plantiphila]|uniref:Uncharacterized protein n=1 Tax=Hansschlegelia plantiphila TaxID=374655 RepID=A0A9W6MW23_9HYPH|nr:hypothetical protein [Hansschlegelia plantiphila]GLK68395.1 hypothetical protein GCM10008179_20330 [Hansschlegelia plantiphila]